MKISTDILEIRRPEMVSKNRRAGYIHKKKPGLRKFIRENYTKILMWDERDLKPLEAKCARLFGYDYMPPWRKPAPGEIMQIEMSGIDVAPERLPWWKRVLFRSLRMRL